MMMARKSKAPGERHQKIIQYLAKHQKERQYPPTIREIGEATSISSTSVVNYYLDQLSEMGYIQRDGGVSRGIRLTDKAQEFTPDTFEKVFENIGKTVAVVKAAVEDAFSIPVLGPIVASEPVPVPGSDFGYFNGESVEIARSMLPSKDTTNLFALQVRGDSMIDAMVSDGDIVVLKHTADANNGDMVAVWLPDRDETTLKYFFKEKDRYRLQPANPSMGPIYIERDRPIEIKGKVVMVVRQFKQ